ncbi:F-box only protein 15 [Genypterus blacodes]|uniref:F-box only protein 15 n=1 Tax=Genypterus blacodes TaxID=154954 RepID=UPI003F76BF0F
MEIGRGQLYDTLQSETLREILSYLDAASLLSLSHVNKLFYQLANDDTIWERLYRSEFGRKKELRSTCSMEEVEMALKMAAMKVQDLPAGYWRRLYWRNVAARRVNKCKMRLKHTSGHTGLPSQTEQVLRSLGITWELTVRDESGNEGTFEPSWSRFFQTSVMLCWNRYSWFDYKHVSSLRLHGVMRIPLACPGRLKPCWRSLMEVFDMEALSKSGQVVGHDKVIKLIQLQPGIITGMWKGDGSVAFVLASLHVHRLMERSTQGSFSSSYMGPVVKPHYDDIDPEYGLHGYHLHIVLHNTACEIMSESFSQLFCRRDEIRDRLIQLTAISQAELAQHVRLSGNITLPWSCEAMQGSVENCCIMSATLLDGFKKPLWCVSAGVSMAQAHETVCYDYDGEHFLIHYQDPGGQVKMKLVQMKDECVLVSLVVYMSVNNINQYFSTDY